MGRLINFKKKYTDIYIKYFFALSNNGEVKYLQH